MADERPCTFGVEPSANGGAAVTLDIGQFAATVDLPRAEVRTFIRALAAAIGDGAERTFTPEKARG